MARNGTGKCGSDEGLRHTAQSQHGAKTGLVVEGLELVLGLGLVLRVARSRGVPGTEAGSDLGIGQGRGQGQVTWDVAFLCRLQEGG